VIHVKDGRHGRFLGCSRYQWNGTGCNFAWRLDGRRLPRRARTGRRRNRYRY
jgi:hypothetical protein